MKDYKSLLLIFVSLLLLTVSLALLWTWGYNGYGQCGIGPENHLSTGYRLGNRTDNVRTPMCLPKEIFFENNRIVEAKWCLFIGKCFFA
jgi:hypothetical protein